eukprot:6245548-Pyramimonas_sp.AAC.1
MRGLPSGPPAAPDAGGDAGATRSSRHLRGSLGLAASLPSSTEPTAMSRRSARVALLAALQRRRAWARAVRAAPRQHIIHRS